MLLKLIISLVLGVFAGIITGLTPGIHINLVSVMVVSASSFLLGFAEPAVISVFIISMAVTHTFLDAIPSIYLGAPDEDTALAVLPGHRLLLEGMGHEAVKLTVIGSLLCLIMSVVLFPLFMVVFPIIYSAIKNYVGWILLFVVVFMILKEKEKDKIFWSTVVFLFSGSLGIVVLSMENLRQPLFPLLSGLFGTSILLYSLSQEVVLPKQRITEMVNVEKKDAAKALIAGVFSGGLTSLFPGLGAAHAAIIAKTFFRSITTVSYLILVGGINTVNFLLSLVTLYTLNKARNGAVIAVLEIIQNINFQQLLIFISASLVVGGIASFLALKISRIFSFFVSKVNYKFLCLLVVALVTALVFVFSGFLGLFVLIVSTSVGLIPSFVGVGKSNAMGCLLLPVILYFLL
ncbi:tripartite tricarboxylate transporter permease [Candidatus Woesearchaeota archaeon]|nr:tripartite tricarboxylate transporter permease [Candidatus Woesearchaeota archaeon]